MTKLGNAVLKALSRPEDADQQHWCPGCGGHIDEISPSRGCKVVGCENYHWCRWDRLPETFPHPPPKPGI